MNWMEWSIIYRIKFLSKSFKCLAIESLNFSDSRALLGEVSFILISEAIFMNRFINTTINQKFSQSVSTFGIELFLDLST